jgi:hypothetical protein
VLHDLAEARALEQRRTDPEVAAVGRRSMCAALQRRLGYDEDRRTALMSFVTECLVFLPGKRYDILERFAAADRGGHSRDVVDGTKGGAPNAGRGTRRKPAERGTERSAKAVVRPSFLQALLDQLSRRSYRGFLQRTLPLRSATQGGEAPEKVLKAAWVGLSRCAARGAGEKEDTEALMLLSQDGVYMLEKPGEWEYWKGSEDGAPRPLARFGDNGVLG